MQSQEAVTTPSYIYMPLVSMWLSMFVIECGISVQISIMHGENNKIVYIKAIQVLYIEIKYL